MQGGYLRSILLLQEVYLSFNSNVLNVLCCKVPFCKTNFSQCKVAVSDLFFCGRVYEVLRAGGFIFSII